MCVCGGGGGGGGGLWGEEEVGRGERERVGREERWEHINRRTE